MTSLPHGEGTSAPLLWLIRAAVEDFDDGPVHHLLDPDEEERARTVFPPALFGWLIREAGETVAVVRQLNADDPRVPYDEVARASSRTLLEFAFRLMHNDPARQFQELHNRFAGQAARLGIDAGVVVHSMRIMERRWVDQMLAAAADRVASVASAVIATSAMVYDTVVDAFVSEYVAEHSSVAGEAVANRRALVEALIQPGTRSLTGFEDLGVNPDAHHLGLILWFPIAGVASQLETLARRIGESTQANAVFTVPGGSHDLWIWLTFESQPPDTVYERVRSVPRDASRIGLAAGPIAFGIRGFRRTHLLARDYAMIAKRLPASASPETADAESVSFVSLLLQDRERAEWFVATELGGLATGTDTSDIESLETLRVYLETGQSLAEAAQRLHIHRNTVVYRVRRIEKAIGRPVASRRHELYAATLLAHLLSQID